jgi:hypothetical protein
VYVTFKMMTELECLDGPIGRRVVDVFRHAVRPWSEMLFTFMNTGHFIDSYQELFIRR